MATSFEISIAVLPSDIDGLGHVNNVVYVRWVQDVAVAHWNALSTPAGQAGRPNHDIVDDSLDDLVANASPDEIGKFPLTFVVMNTWSTSAKRG